MSCGALFPFCLPACAVQVIIKQHGGQFQHYYHKPTCTYVVATNLPTAKIKQLKYVWSTPRGTLLFQSHPTTGRPKLAACSEPRMPLPLR